MNIERDTRDKDNELLRKEINKGKMIGKQKEEGEREGTERIKYKIR